MCHSSPNIRPQLPVRQTRHRRELEAATRCMQVVDQFDLAKHEQCRAPQDSPFLSGSDLKQVQHASLRRFAPRTRPLRRGDT